MGFAPINKVAFDCSGVPVIRRIVDNMREGGVSRFVIVVGHCAESVMAALDGVPGVFYAYQSVQKGTGHVTACGLAVLQDVGFTGRVIVSMGDKIVTPHIVHELLSRNVSSGSAVATIGVLPNPGRSSKGHVIVRKDKELGIVEAKDMERARKTGTVVHLCGQTFTADELSATPYLNAALYAFDAQALGMALKTLRADNAQCELYLTDTIEYFARNGCVAAYTAEVSEMPTFSTKLDLRNIAHRFLRKSSAILAERACTGTATEKVLVSFVEKYGDRPCIVASAPGRVNLMGRHIEHRGGSTNYMATNQRMIFVVALRTDDVVHIANANPLFPEAEFRISDCIPCSAAALDERTLASTAAWLDFLETPAVCADLESSRGHWMNYVKGTVLRFQASADMPLCGMDIFAAGDISVAAGLSSSSALVVTTVEAIVALKELNLSTREFVDLCGEGEWYVGSRGGAGDHAAMKCAKVGCITHLKFKPFEIGEIVPFPSEYSVVVVDSGEQAKKSEGARATFKARIRDYETVLSEVKRKYPELPVAYFRDLAFLPERDRAKALACLTGSVKGGAAFGIKGCRRAEDFLEMLKQGRFEVLGELMKASHDGDRLGEGEYECSTKRIDALCDRLNVTSGVLGSQLVGAGLGGCVIALVSNRYADSLVAGLAADGYHAFICRPSEGSRVEY